MFEATIHIYDCILNQENKKILNKKIFITSRISGSFDKNVKNKKQIENFNKNIVLVAVSNHRKKKKQRLKNRG